METKMKENAQTKTLRQAIQACRFNGQLDTIRRLYHQQQLEIKPRKYNIIKSYIVLAFVVGASFSLGWVLMSLLIKLIK